MPTIYPIPNRAASAALLLSLLVACQDQAPPTAPLDMQPRLTQLASNPQVNSPADPGDGTCDDTECTLREAIAFSTSGASITFAPGFSGTVTLASGELVLNKNLTIAGPAGGTITISGNNTSRVFYVAQSKVVTLSNLTVTGGNGVGTNAVNLHPGQAGWGGGILNDAGTLTVRNSTVSGNSSGGTTRGGGGIAGLYGTLTVENSTISGNSAGWYGGGIYAYGSSIIKNSTISGNSVTNNYGAGGAVYNGGISHIFYTTITGNSARGVQTYNNTGSTKASIDTRMKGSIIAGNSNGDLTLTYTSSDLVLYTSLGYNVIGTASGGDYSGVFLVSDQLGVTSPGLAALADNGGPTKTHALQTGSPALDIIPPVACTDNTGATVTTDQRGTSRPQGVACDVGAYELQVSGGTTPTFTFNLSALPAKTYGDGNFTVTEYVSTNSTGDVTFATGSGSVGCSVTSGGTVTILGAAVSSNACIIEATLAPDATYTGAGPISQSFNIAKAAGSVTISNLPGSGTVGGSFTPTYTKSGDGTASTASNSTGVCTVTSGVVDYIAAGTCLLQASVAEGTDHLAETGGEQSFTISLVTPTFAFDLSSLAAKTFGDESFSVAEYATTNSTGTITFTTGTSSDGCSVTSAGLVTITGAAVDPDHCILAATLAADGAYAAAGPIEQSINIAKAAGSVSINNMPASATVGAQFTPTYTKSGDGTPSVASLTTGVCTVTNGVVTFVAAGTCTLQASVAEGTDYLAATGSEQGVTVTSVASIFASSCTYIVNLKNGQRQVLVTWENATPGVTLIEVLAGRSVTKQLAPTTSGSWSTNVKGDNPSYGLWGGSSRKNRSENLVPAGTECSGY